PPHQADFDKSQGVSFLPNIFFFRQPPSPQHNSTLPHQPPPPFILAFLFLCWHICFLCPQNLSTPGRELVGFSILRLAFLGDDHRAAFRNSDLSLVAVHQ